MRNAESLLKYKPAIVLGITFVVGLFILWEHLNGGVITHHLLADDNMPGISNWWGLITIPSLSWILLSIIQKRIRKESLPTEGFDEKALVKEAMYRFIGGLLFGITAAAFWELNLEYILQYFIYLPVVLALFISVHKPEYYLGFVLGMAFTFGGILPIAFGLVLLLLSFVVHKIIRGGFLFAVSKLKTQTR
ncbi:hypothetical protein ACFQ1M_01745 [Sungkyunkwania multivorans]|uniref:Uncharacterized protein n=1 Tax=Sungkyunkwania multivorans TaxID=1173618 RepID=A0ABW3CV33_9FLAO